MPLTPTSSVPSCYHRYQVLYYVWYLLFSLTSTAADTTTQPSLDIGSTSVCVPLNTSSSTCYGLSHLIPESIATRASIIDAYIDSQINNLHLFGDNCTDAVRLPLCLQYYPMCDPQTNTVSAYVPVNCEESINSGCQRMDVSSRNIELHCTNFVTLNSTSLDQCKSVEQWSTQCGYTMKICNNTSTFTDYVTEWMFRYIMKIDSEIATLFATNPPSDSECAQDHISFRCASVGRCNGNNDRIELTHNQSDCFAARRTPCHSSVVINTISPQNTVCEQWPVELMYPNNTLSTVTTPTTSSIIAPTRAMTTESITDTPTSIITMETSSRPFPTGFSSTNIPNSAASTCSISLFLVMFVPVTLYFIVMTN